MNSKKIAIIAGANFGNISSFSDNEVAIADVLIQRTVYRMNRLIKPNNILILGDIPNEGMVILEKLDAPYMAISKEQCFKQEIIDIIFEEAGLCEKGKDILLNSQSLFEPPYPINVLTVQEGDVEMEQHNLKMDESLGLIDGHVHSNLAYCSENIEVPKAIEVASKFGLKGLCFAEHSGQLYFERKRYWNKTCMIEGIEGAIEEEDRMSYFFDLQKAYTKESVRFGLELDIDFKGKLIVKDKDMRKFDYLIGAIHALPDLSNEAPLQKSDLEDFLKLTERLLSKNIDVLVHPFRVFRRGGWDTPEELFLPVAEMLNKYNVAAEINFHTNYPPVEFIRLCLEKEVKLSLGSDSHNLAEIGDFAYHLDLIEKAGFNGDLKDILI